MFIYAAKVQIINYPAKYNLKNITFFVCQMKNNTYLCNIKFIKDKTL